MDRNKLISVLSTIKGLAIQAQGIAKDYGCDVSVSLTVPDYGDVDIYPDTSVAGLTDDILQRLREQGF